MVKWGNYKDILNLSAGDYTVTVTDAVNCTAQATMTVNQLSQVIISLNIGTDVCGDNSGFISAFVTGGISPYTYLWSNGATTDSIFGLSSGTYTVTVNDLSCSTTTSGIVGLGTPSSIQIVQVNNVSCNGLVNGSVNISVTGVAPFSFLWSNGKTTEDTSNVSAGVYTVTVTNSLSCTKTLSINVTEPQQLNLTVLTDTAFCGVNNGSSSVFVTGGTGVLSYLWNTGSVSSVVSNLSGGNYTVTVTDANGCSVSSGVSVPFTSAPLITVNVVKNVSCFGLSNGSIDINALVGAPFSYLWSNGVTTRRYLLD